MQGQVVADRPGAQCGVHGLEAEVVAKPVGAPGSKAMAGSCLSGA